MKKIASLIGISIIFLTACNATNIFKNQDSSQQNSQSSEMSTVSGANKLEVPLSNGKVFVTIPDDYTIADQEYLPSADVQAISNDKWSIVGMYVDEKTELADVKSLDEYVARLETSNTNFDYDTATVDGKALYADEFEYKQKNSKDVEESLFQVAYVTETKNSYVILVADGKVENKQKHIDTLNNMLKTLEEK